MLRQPSRAVTGTNWGVYFDPDTRRIEIVSGVTIPEKFRYVVSPGDSPLTATVHIKMVDGIATCERAEVERDDGKSLTAQDIRRVAFGQLISEAPQVAAAAPRSGPIRVGDKAQPGVDESALELVRRSVTIKPGIPVDLGEVARVYRAALRDGRPPTAAVADTFKLSPRTASRRVADARKAGRLGAALERRAGERINDRTLE
jgi:hypothetical protein